jgi:hypothetical protein
MRTTVDIPDSKYRLLKSRAASESTTVKALMMRGVDVILSEDRPTSRRRLKLPLIQSKHPATLKINNERIYDLIGLP